MTTSDDLHVVFGTGAIGMALIEELQARGKRVRAVNREGIAEVPEGVEMVIPGDSANLNIDLITPIAMEKGLKFAIREGGRTIGAGSVTDIIE